MQNNTGVNLSLIQVIGDVFADNGSLLDTTFTYGELDIVTPGDKTCFRLIYSDPPEDWSYYELSTGTSLVREVAAGLSILDDSSHSRSGSYELIGFVSNTGPDLARFAEVVGTLYDNAGKVIGCDFTFVSSLDLEPGWTSSFSLTFFGVDATDVASYRLQVEGRPDSPTVPAPTPFEFLENQYFYTNTFGTLHILGEIRNPTSSNINIDGVTANVFDAVDHLVAVGFNFPTYDILQANETTCFDIPVTDAPETWASYQFEGRYVTGGDIAPSLTLLNTNVTTDSEGRPEIIGQVRNDGSSPADFVSVTATLYDADGAVVGCDYSFVATTDLDPGQTSSFSIDFFSESSKLYDTYWLQVQGSP